MSDEREQEKVSCTTPVNSEPERLILGKNSSARMLTLARTIQLQNRERSARRGPANSAGTLEHSLAPVIVKAKLRIACTTRSLTLPVLYCLATLLNCPPRGYLCG